MVFNGPLDREFYYLHHLIIHIDMSYVYLIINKFWGQNDQKSVNFYDFIIIK